MTKIPYGLRLASVTLLLTLICGSCSRTPVRPLLPVDFHAFIIAGNHQKALQQFNRYLQMQGVNDVVPTEQLLQQGTDWKRNGLSRYAFPPAAAWPHMANTLKLMRRFIIPAIGPIKVVSAYRTQRYNFLAGGAPRSKHLEFSALDIIPESDISRSDLHKTLRHLWQLHGKSLRMGIGFYSGRRFHIDTGGYRKW